MGAEMITMSMFLSNAQVAKLDEWNSPFATDSILAEVNTLARAEADESTFHALVEFLTYENKIWLKETLANGKKDNPRDALAVSLADIFWKFHAEGKDNFLTGYEPGSVLTTDGEEPTFNVLSDILWSLHNDKIEGSFLLEFFYHLVKEKYGLLLKDVAESLHSDDVSRKQRLKGVIQFIAGEHLTETSGFWLSIFGESDYNPYPDWLYGKLSLDVESFA